MEFDVCLSFAGEDRTYVRAVADELVGRAVRVFYDEYEEATLWGKNLYTHLDDVYQRQARYCVMFVSEHYVRKFWTAHERESAQARALVEPREYILPARFDRTEVPGLRTTTAYVELQDRAPASLAALICKKLGMSPVGATGELTVHWFGAATVPTAGGADTVAVYQGLPVSTALPHLEAAVGTALRSLAASARPDGPSTYWSHREDRRFDRLYATSAVATALGQLGLPVHGGLLAPAVDYLTGADPGSIDDRAAAMGLLTLGLLDAAGTEALLAALTERLINTGPNRGSFLLRQGPTAGIPEEHWIPSHANGAAFHACHVADLLLHIPADQPQNRRRAEPLLGGVRDFLLRSLNDHGRLLDPQGDTSQRTLYGFALCPALSLPLPAGWQDTVAEALTAAAEPDTSPMNRCFAVMNCAFLYSTTADATFGALARTWAATQLELITAPAVLTSTDAVTVSLALRALAYGVELIAPRSSGYVRAAARSAAETIEAGRSSGDRVADRDAFSFLGTPPAG